MTYDPVLRVAATQSYHAEPAMSPLAIFPNDRASRMVQVLVIGSAPATPSCGTALGRPIDGPANACIVPDDAHAIAVVRELRRAQPLAPMVVVLDGASAMRRSAAFIRAGADVVRDAGEAPDTLDRYCAARAGHLVPASVESRLARGGDWLARVVTWWCLRNAFEPLAVQRIARTFDVDRKTLYRHLSSWGQVTPARLLAWCRILHVAVALDRSDGSVERIAERLHFSSASALHGLVRRLFAAHTSRLRDAGALDRWLAVSPLVHRPAVPAGTRSSYGFGADHLQPPPQ